MGTSNTKPAKPTSTRKYGRSSGFAHWADNIKDRKVIKIKLSPFAETSGSFTLSYSDDSSDDFMTIKSSFTYTGRYTVLPEGKSTEVFGVGIPVTARGDVVQRKDDFDRKPGDELPDMLDHRKTADYDDEDPTNKNRSSHQAPKSGGNTKSEHKRSESLRVPTGKQSSDSMATSKPGELSIPSTPSQNVRTTVFVTERVTCRLTEGRVSASWTITPSSTPDCDAKCSWPWGTLGGRESHTAPAAALDFLGEEDLETGAIDLKFRVPQLAAGWTPPVVVLNEVGGWKLGKKWI